MVYDGRYYASYKLIQTFLHCSPEEWRRINDLIFPFKLINVKMNLMFFQDLFAPFHLLLKIAAE